MCHLRDPQNLGSPGPMCSGVGTADRGSAPGPGRQVNAEEESPEAPQPPGGPGVEVARPRRPASLGPRWHSPVRQSSPCVQAKRGPGSQRISVCPGAPPHLSKAKSQETQVGSCKLPRARDQDSSHLVFRSRKIPRHWEKRAGHFTFPAMCSQTSAVRPPPRTRQGRKHGERREGRGDGGSRSPGSRPGAQAGSLDQT